MKLEGLIVPLITPLKPDESLDEASLERIVEYVIEGGVTGIFVLGSSGEFPGLSNATKERLVQAVRTQIGRRNISLLVGITRAGTRHTIEEGKWLAPLGADAIVVTAPYYYWYSQTEMANHFLTVARAIDVPTVLYNIPPMVKMSLEPETLSHLAKEPTIIGLKDSAGNMETFKKFLEISRQYSNFGLCQGAEEAVVDSVLAGADGLVLGLANIAPRLCRDILDAAKARDSAKVRKLNDQLLRLYPINTHKSFLAGLKCAANLLDLCGPTVTTPFAPLEEDQVKLVHQTLIDLHLLDA